MRALFNREIRLDGYAMFSKKRILRIWVLYRAYEPFHHSSTQHLPIPTPEAVLALRLCGFHSCPILTDPAPLFLRQVPAVVTSLHRRPPSNYQLPISDKRR